MRQVVLDTETTGLQHQAGHRVIEIGCVEIVNRKPTGRHYHQFLNPQREVDEGAIEVHGHTNEFLADKPLFADVVANFLAFVDGAELVIHNASFDLGFLNKELSLLDQQYGTLQERCGVLDTLMMARERYPGQKNNLDALAKRLGVDTSLRELHGALLDAEILADVYLLMTGGQTDLGLGGTPVTHTSTSSAEIGQLDIRRLPANRPRLRVLHASTDELESHRQRVGKLTKSG